MAEISKHRQKHTVSFGRQRDPARLTISLLNYGQSSVVLNLGGEYWWPVCYDGFACLNYGQTALSMYVSKVEVDHERTFMNLHRKGLIEEALVLRGIEIWLKWMTASWVQLILENVSPGKREKGSLDPLYDIFGFRILEEKEKWRGMYLKDTLPRSLLIRLLRQI